jgi:hypothetical protein
VSLLLASLVLLSHPLRRTRHPRLVLALLFRAVPPWLRAGLVGAAACVKERGGGRNPAFSRHFTCKPPCFYAFLWKKIDVGLRFDTKKHRKTIEIGRFMTRTIFFFFNYKNHRYAGVVVGVFMGSFVDTRAAGYSASDSVPLIFLNFFFPLFLRSKLFCCWRGFSLCVVVFATARAVIGSPF